MDAAVVLNNEPERLTAVHRYDILGTSPDPLDRITALAAKIFDVPIAGVSVVEADWIRFRSCHGLNVERVAREPGLCASAILQDEPWLVEDAWADPRMTANPLVTGEPGLRFYLGVPLRTHDGFNLGTLCVIDRRPRRPRPAQVAALADLAAVVMNEFELRLTRRALALERSRRSRAERLAGSLQESLLPPALPAIPGLDLVSRYRPANLGVVGGDFYDVFPVRGGWWLVMGDVSGHGPHAAALTATARHTLRAFAQDCWSPAESLARLNTLMLQQATDETEQFCTAALVRLEPGRTGMHATVALAGHPPPFVVRDRGLVDRGLVDRGLVDTAGAPGTILGCLAQPSFIDARILLSPGDTLVMYTDGITDGRGGTGSLDDTGLRSLLAGLAGRSAGETADAVEKAVVSLAAEPGDDRTLLIARLAR